MKKLVVFLTGIVVTIAGLCLANAVLNRILSVSNYEIHSDKIRKSFCVVLLTDLHNSEFGENNSRLIEKTEEFVPDIIAIAGDMNIASESDNRVVLELCRNLAEIAPVYYSLGNHELNAKNSGALMKEVTETGVHVLDNTWEEIQVGSDTLLIGGLTMYPSLDENADVFLQDFQRQNGFKLLLCHYPEYYLWGMDEWDVDVIMAGHAHGGQIRIPVLGGLYAPDQGYFPKFAEGVYCSGANTMVVSRGLGNSASIPRVNNPPEIVVVDITAD